MRIVGGELGGRRLSAIRSDGIRPTPERVREALFSRYAPWEGMHVLDLFAGSGAIGFEAISRGAASVLAVEQNPKAVQQLKQQAEAFGISDRYSVIKGTLPKALSKIERAYDFVFLDPPYASSLASETLAVLSRWNLPDESILVVEHKKNAPPNLAGSSLEEVASHRYGDTVLLTLKRFR